MYCKRTKAMKAESERDAEKLKFTEASLASLEKKYNLNKG